MSGFGGFGQQQQQSNNTFGSSAFGGGGFSSQPPASASTNPTGFGSSPTANTGFGGGFGTAPAPSTFGASNTFGTSNNAQSGFGSSNTNAAAFGSAAPSTFGSSPAPSGFGSAAPASSSGFGGGFGTATSSSTGGFGGAANGGFGTGFGNTSSAGFGNSNADNSFAAVSTFGNASGGGFNNPDNSGTPPAPLAFGSSSTVAFGASPSVSNTPAPASTGFGFGSPPDKASESSNSAWGSSAAAGNSGWGAAAPSMSGFGGFGSSAADIKDSGTGWGSRSNTHRNSSQTGFGFGSSGQSETKNSTSFGFGSAQSETSSPFGKAAPSQSAITPFGKQNQQRANDDDMGDGDDFPTPSSPFGPRIPRKERKTEPKEGLTSHLLSGAPLAGSRSEESGDDHLAALRAKIQEKKNKLLKMKKNNQTNEAGGSNSDAAAPPSSSFNSELATKNALRFAAAGSGQGQTLSKLLPADLKGRAEEAQSSSSDVQDEDHGDNGNYEDDNEADDFQRNLSSAKSLIGICKSMCPDEELLRREREGDIQLLEITDPGGLHPKDWTLRDTAVKRFRRSAADFKLDIPELVRPPAVLERVCGYLEEWVMERDRQGPDKRFAQQPSIVPPPLDVYQFIWDRTRMIRKDFILQNYIGTGGKCDARAVRCHERIARWHAMCEHQLSHIQEFVTHQSQQNVAELGQTMKTLNLYYDDALGRALTEEAGENNKEYSQGCASDVVMGNPPVDFDGSDLANNTSSKDVSKRIIGANGMKSSTRGTAEPEMRGLYILLTMNNEGGMEVLKYSGRLCTQRPEIFYSRPVQLALSIFQARKDHNYAKFFHLLRSTATPYLFSCIMFKYVEQMRKTALMIMSKTYGAKHKTTGESFYDEYPLERLVDLLCYEDVEEAREACIHYGIKLEGDVIRWRSSKFVEKKDPVKGTTLTLKPKKMLRTIECKLKGATRLSVCRGGVSGDGATLPPAGGSESTSQEEQQAAAMAAERAKKEAVEKEEAQKTRLLQLMQKQKAEEARRKEEAAKKEAERKRLEAIAQEKRWAQQLELERRKKELEEKKKLEVRQEEMRLKQEKEEALLREACEREAAIKRAEEEKRERARLELLEKQRKEEERKLRLAAEAENKRRMEEEARRRVEEEEKQRIAYEAEQQRIAEQERLRRELEEEEKRWRAKVVDAKKILIWSLWTKQMRRRRRLSSPARCLESIDPTVTCYPHLPYRQAQSLAYKQPSIFNQPQRNELENHLYRLATASKEIIDLSQIAAENLWNSLVSSQIFSSNFPLAQPTILFKLSVVFPRPTPENEAIIKSLLTWADSHLCLNIVTHAVSRNRSSSVNIQATPTVGNDDINLCRDCDAALFLLPSPATTNVQSEFSREVLDSLPDDVPRLILLIGDAESYAHHSNNAVIDDVLGPDNTAAGSSQMRNGVLAPSKDELDSALRICCEKLVRTSLKTASNQPIARVSLSKLSFFCLRCMLYNMDANGTHLQYTQPEDAFLALCELSKSTLRSMLNELSNAADEIKCQTMSLWPAKEFLDQRSNAVLNYFEGVDDLPSDWQSSLHDTLSLEVKVFGSLQFLFAPKSFESFVEGLAQTLPSYQQKNIISMLDKENLTGCFAEVVSLVISGEINLDYEEMPTIYLPVRMMDQLIEISGQCVAPVAPDVKKLSDIPVFLYDAVPYSDEVVERVAEELRDAMEDTPFARSPVVMPQLVHKRKPSDGLLAQSVPTSGAKRIRIGQSGKVQSEEERSSKEFTSYLEALLL